VFALRNAGWVSFGHGSVWVTVPDLRYGSAPQALWAIDPKTAHVVARIPLPPDPLTPRFAARYLGFVALDGGDTLTRVDENEPSPLGPCRCAPGRRRDRRRLTLGRAVGRGRRRARRPGDRAEDRAHPDTTHE
jgi:hypothetical protein